MSQNRLRRGTLQLSLQSLGGSACSKILRKMFEIDEGEKQYSKSRRFRKFVRKCDLFPYEQPVSELKSFRSGILSLITIIACISITILEFDTLQKGNPQISIDTDAALTTFAKYPIHTPQLFVTGGHGSLLRKYPYFQNLSYYNIVAHERFIFESDSNDQKPRKKLPIPVTNCDIKMEQYKSKSSKAGWCIGKDKQYSIVGEYSSQMHTRYVLCGVFEFG